MGIRFQKVSPNYSAPKTPQNIHFLHPKYETEPKNWWDKCEPNKNETQEKSFSDQFFISSTKNPDLKLGFWVNFAQNYKALLYLSCMGN